MNKIGFFHANRGICLKKTFEHLILSFCVLNDAVLFRFFSYFSKNHLMYSPTLSLNK